MYCCYAYRLYFLTCYLYKSSLRHIHDPVLSSLKMEGIRLLLLFHQCMLYFHADLKSTAQRNTKDCEGRTISWSTHILLKAFFLQMQNGFIHMHNKFNLRPHSRHGPLCADFHETRKRWTSLSTNSVSSELGNKCGMNGQNYVFLHNWRTAFSSPVKSSLDKILWISLYRICYQSDEKYINFWKSFNCFVQ
jgi:hypothetical protein